MTEDDTFRALSRVPFEMVRKQMNHALETLDPEDLPTWEDFLASMGWTSADFEEEAGRRLKRK